METVFLNTAVSLQAIIEAQIKDEKLPHLIASRLKFHQLELDGHAAYHTERNGTSKPYLPVSLRHPAVETVHQLAHPSGRATAKRVTLKFFSRVSVRTSCAFPSNVCHVCSQRHTGTLEQGLVT